MKNLIGDDVLRRVAGQLGATLGGLFGGCLRFDTRGLGFVLTAMFVVIFLEQWLKEDSHVSSLLGLGIALVMLNLTGSLGTSSAALGQLLQNPLGMLASELTLPFLNWNERRLSVQVSENEYQQAQTKFRQTVYGALKEVHDSLSARQQLAEKDARLTASLARFGQGATAA